MDPITEKFIKYLDARRMFLVDTIININVGILSENLSAIKLEDLEEELIILKSIKTLFLKSSENECGVLFIDFDNLSEVLKNSNLTDIECTILLLRVICRNIKVGVLEYLDNTVDLNKIKEHEFKTLSKEDLSREKLVYNNIKNRDSKTRNLELEWTEEQLEEFIGVAKNYIIDINDIRKAHKVIKECYLFKRKTYDEEDIKNVIISFETLGVIQPVLEMIENYLKAERNHRNSKEQYKASCKKPVIGFNKDLIPNNKNYNKMVNQLNDMVHLREMMPKDYYTLNQVVDCVSWMMKMGIRQEEIRKFLWNTEIFNQNREVHIITKYLELYEKLKYYENKLVLFDELRNLEECFQSLFIADDEEYAFWKSCLEEELNNYLKQIPGGYMYEIDMATRKTKKKG